MSSGYDASLRRWSGARAAARHDAAPDTRLRAVARRLTAAPELLVLMALTAVLNLWDLSINGWANTYYSGAMRAMSASWHNFLYTSLDQSGLMTLDKPPLALWIQALSVRIFGMHPLSILVPQALMGVAASALLYDLTRRRFGRLAGFAAGFALATTPVIVAVSRHNNPDELLVLCSVAALWCFVRSLERGSLKWLVLSAVCVGLGFETKMLVAFMIVPGMTLAWLWAAPVPMLVRLRRGVVAAVSGLAVALAWPILVTLTPAADRPWISGTSDNSIWSLIFGYNGVGRVAGQTGGPGGAGGPGGNTMFGGATGPFRLLQSGLGDQAGWLLGAALAAGIALLVLTRLRRGDPRTGWVLATGGALVTTLVVFSYASGIFHPYYVSFLAPWTAALVGAGVGMMRPGRPGARWIGPALLIGGAITELVVLGGLNGQLARGKVAAIAAIVIAAALALAMPNRLRLGLAVAGVGALMLAPATWATETLGHVTSSTFPAGGPASAGDGFGGGPRGFGGGRGLRPGGRGAFIPGGGGAGFAPPGANGAAGGPPAPGGARPGGLRGGGPGGLRGDSTQLHTALAYAQAHGGGTIGVESQSSAAQAILDSGAKVAGLGGFSGRESTVSVRWLAQEVASGHLRWVLGSGDAQMTLPGDTRTGSSTAFAAVTKACAAVNLGTSSTSGSSALGSLLGSGQGTSTTTLYDCHGRAAAIVAAAAA